MTKERPNENTNSALLSDKATPDRTAERPDRDAEQLAEHGEQMVQLRVARRETELRPKKGRRSVHHTAVQLMVSLVAEDVVPLLEQRGIPVDRTIKGAIGWRNGLKCRVDLLVVSDREVVIVEVRTTLRSRHLTHFPGKLDRFTHWFPEYRNHTILGAVAYLRSDLYVIACAVRQGLFVIRAAGKSASIVNEPDFVPRAFA